MKTVNDVITIMESEIDFLKRLIINVKNDDDELLKSEIALKSSLISSYGQQITLLKEIINRING